MAPVKVRSHQLLSRSKNICVPPSTTIGKETSTNPMSIHLGGRGLTFRRTSAKNNPATSMEVYIAVSLWQ